MLPAWSRRDCVLRRIGRLRSFVTAPDFLPAWPPAANAFLIFGLLLLAGLAGGRLAATTRVLPAITGYIATGFLLGPAVDDE